MKKIREVTITGDDIDRTDQYFRFGHPEKGGELEKSIISFGLIDPPFLLEGGEKYQVFTGFNRVEILFTLGKPFKAMTIREPDEEVFMQEVGKKLHHERIGPAGKIRVCEILKENFSREEKYLRSFGQNVLNVPVEFIPGGSLYAAWGKLPSHAREYFDMRDVPFRLIKSFLLLSEKTTKNFSRLMEKWDVGKNNFRKALELIGDIEQAGKGDDLWQSAVEKDISSLSSFDEFFRFLFSERYPSYSEMAAKRDELVRAIERIGISVTLPSYFEGSEIAVTLKAGKDEGAEMIGKRAASLNLDLIDELLRLL